MDRVNKKREDINVIDSDIDFLSELSYEPLEEAGLTRDDIESRQGDEQ